MPEFPIVSITEEQDEQNRDRLQALIAELAADGTSARHILDLRGRLDRAGTELQLVRDWIDAQQELSGRYADAARQLVQLLGWPAVACHASRSPGPYWRDSQVIGWRGTGPSQGTPS